jgi:SET domain-containing protein
MALINHSCSPNASVILYSPRQMVVRAACDMEAGEEVTITYAGPTVAAPIAVRREYLRKGFGFTCTCPRCLVEQDYEMEPVGEAGQVSHVPVLPLA